MLKLAIENFDQNIKSEVGLQCSAPSHVTRPTVEPTAQRIGVSQGDWDTLDTKVLEHLRRKGKGWKGKGNDGKNGRKKKIRRKGRVMRGSELVRNHVYIVFVHN